MFNIRKDKILMPWALVFFWMSLIFYLSAQPVNKSNGLSTQLTEIIIDGVGKVAPQADFNINRVNHLLRKNAHFFAYLVLGVLLMNAFRRSGAGLLKSVLFSLLICILYAISDEVHQLSVPGRGGQVKDVLIDSAGAFVGVLGYISLKRIKDKKQYKGG